MSIRIFTSPESCLKSRTTSYRKMYYFPTVIWLPIGDDLLLKKAVSTLRHGTQVHISLYEYKQSTGCECRNRLTGCFKMPVVLF